MNHSCKFRQRGQTLFELVLVVAVLAVMASVAVPSMTASSGQRLSHAVSEVADAFRFARDQARRSGVMHGVETDPGAGTVRVFRVEEKPGSNVAVFDVYHPVTKQPYAIQLGASPFANVRVVDLGGDASGACSKINSFVFDARGVVHCIDPVATLFKNAFVELGDQSLTSVVKLDAYTGRVLVQ
jgi:prepilin-type N-terminal cleavage/methylation domain-containing protein